MKLTPRSMAWLSAASEVLSSVDPQSAPPIPHAPKPMADIFQPVRPKARYSICVTPSVYYGCRDCRPGIYSIPVMYTNGRCFCKKATACLHATPGTRKGCHYILGSGAVQHVVAPLAGARGNSILFGNIHSPWPPTSSH